MAMHCPDKANPQDFLEGLRMKQEELLQAGVVIDEDYFSVIISSLPLALSNFASNQLAAAQFLSSKTMTPDDLLSMLMEESDHQQAQQARRQGSKKAKDEDEGEGEALAVKPKRGWVNVTRWTCNKVGHYSFECEEPEKSDDEPKDEGKPTKGDAKTLNNSTAATIELDNDCGGAWATEEVEDVTEGSLLISDVANELDWFERAIAEMDHDAELVVTDIPMRNWFHDVVEGENELKDKRDNLKGPLVDGFDKAFVEDSSTAGPVWPDCDNIEGTGMLPSTLLGPFTPVVDREGEYEGSGRTTCDELSGMAPDFDFCGNPWIDDATMEWSNHAITLQASAEVVTHSLDNPREREDTPDVQVHAFVLFKIARSA